MFKQFIATAAMFVCIASAQAQNVVDVYKNLMLQRAAPQNPVVVYILTQQVREYDQQRYAEESQKRMQEKSAQGQQFLNSLKQKQERSN
jgi:hypothetical protein